MKKYYETLGLNAEASAREIIKAYRELALIYHPDKGGNQQQFQEMRYAVDCLLGTKTPSDQFCDLFNLMKEISSISGFFLLYDNEPLSEGQSTPVFDRTFYANGEIIKLCQRIVALFEQRMREQKSAMISQTIPEEAILPCVNKILSILQLTYQFDHYDTETTLAGYNYVLLLQRINLIFKSIRPELIKDIHELYKNTPPKIALVTNMTSSLLPGIIDDLKLFIKVISDPINDNPSMRKRRRLTFFDAATENTETNKFCYVSIQ